MSQPAAMPYFGDAYMADTRHLTLEEHGAYHLLLLIAWRSPDCTLPDDDRRLAQMLGVTTKKWAVLKPVVMAFWMLTESGWEQKRLKKEYAYVQRKRSEQSERAQGRWGEQTDNGRKRSERLAEARKKGRHNKGQWQALLDATGHQCVKCRAADCELVKDHITPIYQGGSDAISNIQPLCVRCNSSKSADDTDFRLSVCKDLYERLPECLPERLNGRSKTSAPPPPLGSNEPIESSNEDSPSDDEPSLRPEHVFEFYQKLAAELVRPVPRDFTPERRQLTRGRIAQYTLDDFHTVIAKCRGSPFLRGDKGRTPLTFDWLMKKQNFQKVLEGNYDG
jgi:uncharacterized protein YdaU (DUF1376 family)